MSKGFQTLKFKHGKDKFELMLKPNAYGDYMNNKLKLSDILLSDEIYESIKEGKKGSKNSLKEKLSISTDKELFDHMIRNGEYNMSSLERKTLVEDKKKQICNYFHSNFIDTRIGAPPSLQILADTIKSLGLKIDPFKNIRAQADSLLSKLEKEISLKKCDLYFELKAEVKHYGKMLKVLHKYGEINKEDFEGSEFKAKGNIKPKDMDGFVSALNACADGEAFDIIFPELVKNVEGDDKQQGKKKQGKGKKKGKGKRK